MPTLKEASQEINNWTGQHVPFINVSVPKTRRKWAWKQIESARAGFIGQMKRQARGVLDEIYEEVDDALRQTLVPAMAEDAAIDRLRRQTSRLRKLFRFIYVTVGERFAQRTADQIRDGASQIKQDLEPGPGEGQLPTAWRQEVDRILEQEAGSLITGVRDSIRSDITEIIQQQVDDGAGIGEIRRALETRVNLLNAQRAERIARTETLRASNSAVQWTSQRFTIPLQKTWLATQDSRVRASHAAASGQTVPRKGTFTVGGYTARYPVDPQLPPEEAISCRCTMILEPRNP